MVSRGDNQGAVIMGSGAPPATLIAAVGTIYLDISNSNNMYLMLTSGAWGAPGTTGGTATGTGDLVRATAPTLSFPIIGVVAVGALPAAAAGNKGARATVSDSNATTTAGIGAVVAAGGANCNPVYSDGAAWRIG